MIAFLTRPAELEIEIAGQKTRVAALAGLAIATAPAQVGRPLFRILRAGKIAVEKESDWQIHAEGNRVDPLYVGGSTTRALVLPN